MQIVGNGVSTSRATAALATVVPYDTQQIGVDNSLVGNMRCAVGRSTSSATAQLVY